MAVVTVDFDGTLYKGNSFNAMFKLAKKEFTVKEWLVVFAGLIKASVLGLFKGKNEFRKQFFMAFAKSFKGKTEKEMNDFFQKLVNIGKVDINEELVSKIREHQQ
ncbi:MAG TPA: HAD family hydrolase, partial [Virgibacillus sp.]